MVVRQLCTFFDQINSTLKKTIQQNITTGETVKAIQSISYNLIFLTMLFLATAWKSTIISK